MSKVTRICFALLCLVVKCHAPLVFLGTIINQVEGGQFFVFAPNAKALQDAVDKINETVNGSNGSKFLSFVIL